MTRRPHLLAMAFATVWATAGCTASTRIELESADGPAVAPADGSDGQNDASVIGAGAIDTVQVTPEASTTPDPPVTTTSANPTSSTSSTSSSKGGGATTTTGSGAVGSDLPEVCADEFARLTAAVDGYIEEYGIAPVSEGELVATAHLRMMSNVYDVWIDGSLRPAGDTCAQPG